MISGNGNGLSGTYHSGDLSTTPVLSRIDSALNFNWSKSSPSSLLRSTNYSVEWTGQVLAPQTGTYTFTTNSDDGVRLWVNGQRLIDNWKSHSVTQNNGTIALTAGQKYDIKVDYYQNAGNAVLQLYWTAPQIPKQIIPQGDLYAASNVPSTAASILDPAFHDSDFGSANDAHPDGVPSSYNWYQSAAQPGWGNNPPLDWYAMTAWGQVYAAQGWHPENAPNTRVQIKDLETWVLSKSTGKWSEIQQANKVDGAAYASDFGNNGAIGVTTKDESNNGGGISVTAGNGYNYHFWTDRASIDPADIAGVYTKFQARLVLDNPQGTDDRSSAQYIASAGADYWRGKTADWASDWSNNGGVGGGRFKWVTNDWQNFSMETLSASQLLNNPPPLVS